ncbi:unnamed protein product [Rotaria sp. Silwood1]|nr:unnamed protein product [Rotaria sp. Silwood1]CAF1395222.1 unnamed protein product [Rotaria sp. Silwood1]CAF1396702.1 unnamed protein product [Rotaria sp. Silwood1]CAF3622350.1 unnamed protein product [Rotaria sp. Silwood1]CAF3668357.1 unnamed protein product [Rotaria sp. Silwood1]
MNNNQDINPFDDPSIRQATAQTLSNQQTFNEYKPFSNATSVKLKSANTVVTLSSSDQPPSYSSAITSIPVQQETENFSSNTNRIDLTL